MAMMGLFVVVAVVTTSVWRGMRIKNNNTAKVTFFEDGTG